MDLNELLTAHRAKYVNLANRQLRSHLRHMAEDCVQEAAMGCLQSSPAYWPGYFAQAVANVARRLNRQHGQHRFGCTKPLAVDSYALQGVLPALADPECQMLAKEVLALVHQADRPMWQHAIETGQHTFAGFDPQRRNQLFRSKKKLREMLR